MTRIVLVTTVRLDPGQLDRIVTADDEVHVVTPAVGQSKLQWLTNAEDEPRAEAARLARDLAESSAPVAATAEENREGPAQSVLDAVRQYRPDRVVVVLREEHDASWLESGEARRIPSEVEGVPVVTHVLGAGDDLPDLHA